VSRSDGRFGSDFRLAVSKKSSSHFIFLEASQLQWIDGVLRVAEGSKWFIPGVCESASDRRSVVVAKVLIKGTATLKIIERCSNGQVFYVLIPAADSSGGWSPLRELLQGFCNVKPDPIPPSLAFGARSFAEVTTAQGLPIGGRCGDTLVEGETMIHVEAEGVKERRAFLDKCLEFRFKEGLPIPWNRFRQWMLRHWGVALNELCYPLGDDLWLLECGSSTEVDRILALKRFLFEDSPLLVDRWIAMAGRSSVLQENDMVWLNVHGIPLHLRSSALFEKIGDWCGGFVKAEEGASLSDVRIKIRVQGAIPEEIPICFEKEIFPVRVVPVVPKPISNHGRRESFMGSWRAKGGLSSFSSDPRFLRHPFRLAHASATRLFPLLRRKLP
ncbi:hypothetical protein LINPERHAP2_LOCUS8109, partial [Linum perenne]